MPTVREGISSGEEGREGNRMNAIAAHGKLLTPDESVRLAVLKGLDRQKLIEAYVKRMRDEEISKDARVNALNRRWTRESR